MSDEPQLLAVNLVRSNGLKLSPSKARLGATDAAFLGHSISPAGVRPNAEKVLALTLMPMPRDLKQLRSLLGDLSYYLKFVPDMSKRIRPITVLLKKGIKFLFTPSIEVIVRDMLAELAAPPLLVSPDWDAVEDATGPFRVHCDASIDGFGATLKQEQPDGSVKPIAYVSRATLNSERHWTPLDLEAGSIVWAIKRLRGYTMGYEVSHFFGPQDSGKYRESWTPQCASPEVARVSHRIRLHTRVPERKREW